MKPSFSAGAFWENKIWFSDSFFNAFMNMDIETGECSLISPFPGEKLGKALIHKSAFYYGGKIIFTPDQGNNVHVYDLETGSIKSITISDDEHSRYSFSNGVVINGKIWICPGNINYPIHVIDITTGVVDRISLDEVLTIVSNKPSEDEEHFYRWVLIGDELMAVVINSGIIIKCNVETMKVSYLNISVNDVDSIYNTGNAAWLCGGRNIYRWDYNNNIEKCIVMGSDAKKIEPESYRICGNSQVGIYAFYWCGGEILTLTGNTFMPLLNVSLKRTSSTTKGIWYDGTEVVSDNVFIFPPYESVAYKIKNNTVCAVPVICLNTSEICKQLCDKSILIEGQCVDLEDFVSIL